MTVNRYGILVLAVAALGCVAQPSASSSPGPSATPATVSQATSQPGTAAPTAGAASPLASAASTPQPRPTETVVTATVQPTASPQATLAPTSQPTTTTGGQATLTVDWQRQLADPGIGYMGEEPFMPPSSIVIDGRFVVIGRHYDQASVSEGVAIWISSDGLTWRKANVEALTLDLAARDAGMDQRIADVTLGGPGAVAIGYEQEGWTSNPNGAVWVSDDGEDWTRAYDEDLVGTGRLSWIWPEGDQLLAYGEGRLFSSSDGLSWDPVVTAEAPDRFAGAALKSATGLVVFNRPEGPQRAPLSVWRLTSAGWQQLADLPASGRAAVDRGAVGPRGWVVTGTRYLGREVEGVGWWSVDGETWQTATVPPGLISNDVLGDEAGFVAAGYRPPAGCAFDWSSVQGTTWTSVDGLTWREMASGEWASRSIFVLERNGRSLIGVGVDFTDENHAGEGAVWTANLPQTQQHDAEPAQPAGGFPTGCGE